MGATADTKYRVGIDVGGTFTDLVAFDPDTAAFHTLKTPSRPDAPHRAVLDGLDLLRRDFGVPTERLGEIIHGTTIGVNTLLQRSGARVGLLINQGFRDILLLGRVRLPDVYSYLVERPAPIAPRRFIREIDVRRLADGTVDKALDEEQVRASARDLAAMGVEAIAVCFLHSYKFPEDELRAIELIGDALPGVYACSSSDLWPQMREYERAMVALINSHIGPTMKRYYTSLLTDLADGGWTCDVYSTRSNGGVMTVRTASERPVETLLSGPASGVVAASYVARLAGFDTVVALDMGGTSTEAAVIRGSVRTSSDSEVGDFPVILPAVDVRSIGAGGGSIAWLDRAGVLKVGPRSAGANPGPASYGHGGTEPTVTDAYLALGILSPEGLLGGRMKLDRTLARTALATITAGLGSNIEEAAEAILRVATSNMYAKLMLLLAQGGLDPRDTAILAYGGAGPTHAFLLADEVGIKRVIVPRSPGTLCALGCLVADLKSDFIRTVNLRLQRGRPGASGRSIATCLADLGAEARAWLARERPGEHAPTLLYAADVRYVGQAFTIEVGLPDPDGDHLEITADVIRRFETEYMRRYSVENSASDIDLVNLRLTVIGETPKPKLVAKSSQRHRTPPASATRQVRIDGEQTPFSVYQRDELASGDLFHGPAIVEQYDTTSLIPKGFTVLVDEHLNLIGRRS